MITFRDADRPQVFGAKLLGYFAITWTPGDWAARIHGWAVPEVSPIRIARAMLGELADALGTFPCLVADTPFDGAQRLCELMGGQKLREDLYLWARVETP
jgi:hypothetical protein